MDEPNWIIAVKNTSNTFEAIFSTKVQKITYEMFRIPDIPSFMQFNK